MAGVVWDLIWAIAVAGGVVAIIGIIVLVTGTGERRSGSSSSARAARWAVGDMSASDNGWFGSGRDGGDPRPSRAECEPGCGGGDADTSVDGGYSCGGGSSCGGGGS
ncbi:hypothetical protein [Nocardia cyriacigeorgica]|uniref:Uncharacterized protein n=1 Tax=Nocardia cyriacigeorgica TaxID=135487 RepID=A0A5R8NX58_9NOCA|nr:hypothetical protein [Nocardia cyriacigeorgica]TLF80821.1 hypothetical protein FEK34_03750 [Nocardia cyriacigeorgica]